MLVESEIERLSLRCDSRDEVHGVNGRLHCDMWESMKAVSHFNIEIALELTLKLILRMNEIPVPTGRRGHQLRHLFEQLPLERQLHLDEIYQAKKKFPQDIVSKASVNSPTPPSLPPVDLSSLHGFLTYLDEYVKLWEKRYSWELVDEGQWRHYLFDLSVLVELISDVLRHHEKYY